jgi:hypothetical protein
VPLWRLQEFIDAGQWILPASHFLMDESPSHAAVRVARTWGGVRHPEPQFVVATSELFPTQHWEGRAAARHRLNHWALCFVYEVRTDATPRKGPGWAELAFQPMGAFRTLPIGRGHGDLVREYVKAKRSAAPAR